MNNNTQPKKKVRNHYVNNKTLYTEMVKYRTALLDAREAGKAKPPIPNYVGECLMLIANRLSFKVNFINYSYKEEMVLDGIENCFHRSTVIMTIEHGPIDIEKIEGKYVTVKCRDGIWRKAFVKSYGRQMLYEYDFAPRNKTKNIQQKVIATANHRWFVKARLSKKGLFEWGDKVVSDLRVGDMLENARTVEIPDNDGILHGIIFGDGSVQRSIQGKEFPFIRVCKKDKVGCEITRILDSYNYTYTQPLSANGDRVYYLNGGVPFLKDLPHTNDPAYIAGFIHGWWLADGTKGMENGHLIISTIRRDAVEWLRKYAAYAGYHILNVRNSGTENRNGYRTDNPLYTVTLGNDLYYDPRVKTIREFGVDEVFCLEEPVTNSFVLGNGLLTGNCIAAIDNFDPEKSSNPFAYFTQIMHYAFIRRIQKEQKQAYVKHKNFEHIFLIEDHSMFTDDMVQISNEYSANVVQSFENKLTKAKQKAKIPTGLEIFKDESIEE